LSLMWMMKLRSPTIYASNALAPGLVIGGGGVLRYPQSE